MFGVGPGSSAHPRDSENSQSIQSERNGVEEAAAAAAREVARELGAGGAGAGGRVPAGGTRAAASRCSAPRTFQTPKRTPTT
jgi:phage repressor protein C with HTH and peptisase S24 domain